MSNLSCYIAASLDGFIADADGKLDWLTKYDSCGEDLGYTSFYRSIDAMIMGRITYNFVSAVTPWPHADRPCFVMSRDKIFLKNVKVLSGDFIENITRLKKDFKKIWLAGGGQLVSQALECNLLDELILTTVPVALGRGTPLFVKQNSLKHFKASEAKIFNCGLVQVSYLKSAE